MGSETTMGEPVTQSQFFEAVQQLRDLIDAKHSNQRIYIAERFDALDRNMDIHAAEDRLVEKRVTRIETEREIEGKQAMRRGVWAGILASVGLNGLVQAVKMMLGK